MTFMSLVALAVFTLQGVDAAEKATGGSGKSVLVVAEESAYKTELVEAIATMAKEIGYKSKVVDTAALTEKEAAAHAAVVVVLSVPGWRTKKGFPAFLGSANADVKSRMVVVTTANKANWTAGDKGVDAITTASKIGNVAVTVNKVAEKLDRILSPTK